MNSFNFAAKGIERGDRAAGRDLRVRRRGRAGDAPLRPRQRGGAAAALEGGGAGLPLLPGARPRARSSRPRAGRAAARRSCRSRPGRGSAGSRPRSASTLAEGLVTSGRDDLYARIPRRPARGRERRHERARRDRRRPGGRERGGAREAGRARATRSRARRSPRRSPQARRRASRRSATSPRPRRRRVRARPGDRPDPGRTRAQVAAYRGGKEGLLGFFVGQVMKETGGKANPKVVNERLREKLNA